jgi:hypothetical protein
MFWPEFTSRHGSITDYACIDSAALHAGIADSKPGYPLTWPPAAVTTRHTPFRNWNTTRKFLPWTERFLLMQPNNTERRESSGLHRGVVEAFFFSTPQKIPQERRHQLETGKHNYVYALKNSRLPNSIRSHQADSCVGRFRDQLNSPVFRPCAGTLRRLECWVTSETWWWRFSWFLKRRFTTTTWRGSQRERTLSNQLQLMTSKRQTLLLCLSAMTFGADQTCRNSKWR